MEALLFALALLILVSGGSGLALLLKPSGREFHLAEFTSLSILLGSGMVTLATFIAGFFLNGWSLRFTVAFAAIGIAIYGYRHKIGDSPRINRESLKPSLASVVLCAEVVIVTGGVGATGTWI